MHISLERDIELKYWIRLDLTRALIKLFLDILELDIIPISYFLLKYLNISSASGYNTKYLLDVSTNSFYKDGYANVFPQSK